MRRRYEAEIRLACSDIDVIVISHYHDDHHIPDQGLYRDKHLLIKDPKKSINRSQRWRVRRLLEGLEADVEVADEIIEIDPDLLIIDDPPTYLLGFIFAYYNLARGIINLCRILEEVSSETIILDHHLLRDYRYLDLLYSVYRRARELGRRLSTAAELMGFRPLVLEAYETHGPTRWSSWSRFNGQALLEVLRNAVEGGLLEVEWVEWAKELLTSGVDEEGGHRREDELCSA